MVNKPKILWVIPWFGETLAGGAETLCRHYSQQMKTRGWEIEVLTTCGRSLSNNWNQNHYPEGIQEIGGVTVRRFPVTPGNHQLFNDLNRRLLTGGKLTLGEEVNFFRHSINSLPLLDYLKRQREAVAIFLPYPFGLVFHGILTHQGTKLLLPCLHREPYAELRLVREMFALADGIIFNSDAERELAFEHLQLPVRRSIVLGMGIDPHTWNEPAQSIADAQDYLLYIGRKDATKNVPQLVKFFTQLVQDSAPGLKLLLLGPDRPTEPPAHDSIIDLGFVSEEKKRELLVGALALCQPSLRESFSIVLMESWLCKTPVLVNKESEVLRRFVLETGGGLFYGNYLEFRESVSWLQQNREPAKEMAQRARELVVNRYSWDRLLARLHEFLHGSEATHPSPSSHHTWHQGSVAKDSPPDPPSQGDRTPCE